MKFDFVIGNPPYQDETLGDNKGYAPPVYNYFLDEACKVSDFVEMIHPARFLFDAGSTPKKWNEKKLSDKHFKVLFYENDSSKVFANTSIPGGVAITVQDNKRCFDAIEIFTPYSELNSILKKVKATPSFKSMSEIVVTRTAYRLTAKMHSDHPEAINQLSKGHAYDMSTNIFQLLPQIFFDTKPADGNEYIQIYGREGTERRYKYIRREYVNTVCNLTNYKILFSKADGAAGQIGNPVPARIIGKSEIAPPMVGSTESFISVGMFETNSEAISAVRYIETKFARALLGVLKTTQDITPDKWKYVPLQDFTSKSDIDWSQPVANVDKQLFKKYDLSDTEIKFIDTYIKEMALS